MKFKKGELVWDELIPWIIAFGVAALMSFLIFILSGKGRSVLEYLKSIFRFG